MSSAPSEHCDAEPGTPRKHSLSLRLSDDERDALVERARKAHLPLAVWMRTTLLREADRGRLLEERATERHRAYVERPRPDLSHRLLIPRDDDGA